VWAANGSNEIIQQLLLAFGGPGRSALGFEPSYSMHPIIAQVTGTRWIAAGRDEDFGLDAVRVVAAIRRHRPDAVFLTSPNNPTGTAVDLGVIEAACEQAGGLVVVDEAYAEFARDVARTALELLPRHPNLVVTRTMRSVRNAMTWWAGCAAAACRLPSRMRTSFCTVYSLTGTRCGGHCWSGEC